MWADGIIDSEAQDGTDYIGKLTIGYDQSSQPYYKIK